MFFKGYEAESSDRVFNLLFDAVVEVLDVFVGDVNCLGSSRKVVSSFWLIYCRDVGSSGSLSDVLFFDAQILACDASAAYRVSLLGANQKKVLALALLGEDNLLFDG